MYAKYEVDSLKNVDLKGCQLEQNKWSQGGHFESDYGDYGTHQGFYCHTPFRQVCDWLVKNSGFVGVSTDKQQTDKWQMDAWRMDNVISW